MGCGSTTARGLESVTAREDPGSRGSHRGAGRATGWRTGSSGSSGPRHRAGGRIADPATLGGRASRALGLSFVSTVLSKASLFGVGIMLARLLGPHAFGTYAVAYVALVAVLNFNELGVSLAIVRWPGDPREIAPTVTTISLAVSVLIYLGCFFAAPPYAAAMGAPAATPVIRVLALVILSDGFTNTPVALLQRSFRQGSRTIADQVNVWLGTAVTIGLAWSGMGAMSLAIGRLAGCLASTILFLIFAPEGLRLGFDPAKARALLRFGLPLAGANLLTFAIGSADQIVVGHLLGPVQLGYYVLALNLAGWPIGMFSQPVRVVGPAVFARLQHDAAAMRSTFLTAAGLLCAVALPVCLLIAGTSVPLISFVYGTRWLPSARPLLWLALLGGVQVFFLLAYDYFVVLARSRFLLITQLAWLAALIGALAAGARLDGIYGAGLGEFAVAALGILPWYLVELRRCGIRLAALAGHLRVPLAGAAATGLIGYAAARAFPAGLAALAIGSVAGAAITGLMVFRMRAALSQFRMPAAGTSATSTAAPPLTPGPAAAAPETATAGVTTGAAAAVPGGPGPDDPATDPAFAALTTARPAYPDVLGLPPAAWISA